MSTPDSLDSDAADVAKQIAAAAESAGLTIAVAESLTGGKLACHLAAAPSSSIWFRGGVVAYSSEVKYEVLGVPRGPVISESCALAMADGVAKLLGADVAVAVTGVGGPDPQDGQPPGTVCFGVTGGSSERQRFDGGAEVVLDRTVMHGLELLRRALETRAASVE